jgi:gamma-glutamyl-gamma-aminobutyrate hydrolase PuuD
MHSTGASFKETLVSLGDKVGVPRPQGNGQEATANGSGLAEPEVRDMAQALFKNEKVLKYLREKRGLKDDTIRKYQLGWNAKSRRFSIPIRDEEGRLANIRYYSPSQKPKIINSKGHGNPPRLYGADEIHPAVYGVDARHDAFDLALAKAAIELRMPILAICRGHQLLNVALGGTLIQHLGDERTSDHRFRHHTVELHPGCRTALAMGTERPVGHSVHHQAIDRVAKGMVVTGRADDGTIEAMESVDGWVVSVQWHPEDDAHEWSEQQGLFDALVAACSEPRARVSRDQHGCGADLGVDRL